LRFGAVGGEGGQSFSDSCEDVAEVHVRAGYVIDAIQLVCRTSNGALLAKPVRGGAGGSERIFELQPGESITAVSGSALNSGTPFVFSLQFQTNQRLSPVYGNEGPTKGQLLFRFDLPAGSRFGGLFGEAARYLSSLGVLASLPPGTPARAATWRLGPVGGNAGGNFADRCDEVAEVHVREGYYIDAIQLVCRGPNGTAVARPARGGAGGTEQTFHLQPGERIIAVSGSALGPNLPFVFSVQFRTNLRSSPVYGNHGPTRGQRRFQYDIPTGTRLGGLFGQASQYLSSLGVVISR